MDNRHQQITDGNTAVADIAYRTNEICIIYPITPASLMGELTDQWSAQQKPNAFGTIPAITQMQSEAGAAGAIHGALQTGSLVTTFTSSQGLLLMIPDMYRIAGELTPTVFHVASRAVAAQGMTIYCEHSDVMATRATGFALINSCNVQEAQDMALISQAASLQSRVPFLHFFDGFRTSHEVRKIAGITDEQIRQFIDNKYITEHRQRRMSPENPFMRGVIYNSDIYFQQREAVTPFYDNTINILHDLLLRFHDITGRKYNLVEYYGHPEAESVIVIMGSAVETARETVEFLRQRKVGVIHMRLFQPFPADDFFNALPKTCKALAVLDRCKEPGAGGEPLYQKVATAIITANNSSKLNSNKIPKIIAGRYGIGGKEFTPAMVKAIFIELISKTPKQHFTIGINDDISHSSLNYDKNFNIEKNITSALFYGLGSDGTVSANKNSIKIIGELTDNDVQAYFVYDSRKSGSRTVSHLRFGAYASNEPILGFMRIILHSSLNVLQSEKLKIGQLFLLFSLIRTSKPERNLIHLKPRAGSLEAYTIRSAYLITKADFIGCHQFTFINTLNIVSHAKHGATILLNSPFPATEAWKHLSTKTQQELIEKNISLYVIDAYKLAKQNGLGNKINTIMQTCFFSLTNIIDHDIAIDSIKQAVKNSYQNKGDDIVTANLHAIDAALNNYSRLDLDQTTVPTTSPTTEKTNDNVTIKLINHLGDTLPVSALPPDGTYPVATSKLEQRNISPLAAEWQPEACIQCGRCNLACPHGVIRAKFCHQDELNNAPASFKYSKLRGKDSHQHIYALQIYPENCTGCGLCVSACPVKDKAIKLSDKKERIADERINAQYFSTLPEMEVHHVDKLTINNIQFIQPLFEFSGACAGCGEAPYVKLLSKLFGHRLLIANACGCSSVFGGNLPTSPWTYNSQELGPTWSSSLFEDNAEFAFGFLLSEEKQRQQALELLKQLSKQLPEILVTEIIQANQINEKEIQQQRDRVTHLKQLLAKIDQVDAQNLLSIADFLVKHSIWAVGGDGWAYDIGFAGVDHVIASGKDINLLILDTEVYSNTGGQASKATPRGSVVKFAAEGKQKAKKDLGLITMTYGDIYVANISLGANPAQAIKAFVEAENYPGPSIIIAYCHCIAHGIDMQQGLKQQELAVKSGYWPLYRFDPRRKEQNLNPLQIDSSEPTIPFTEYAMNENRFKQLMRKNKQRAQQLVKLTEKDIAAKWKLLRTLSEQN